MKAMLHVIETLSPACKTATFLQSRSLDTPLPLAERMGLRLHLLLCKSCRRYARQIEFLRESFHRVDAMRTAKTAFVLTDEDRAGFKTRLRQEMR